jgi:hypothetical protein
MKNKYISSFEELDVIPGGLEAARRARKPFMTL